MEERFFLYDDTVATRTRFVSFMGSCLMFKILSGASKDSTRYQMLRKIGVRRGLLTQSIYKELFFIFLVPAIVGIVHISKHGKLLIH